MTRDGVGDDTVADFLDLAHTGRGRSPTRFILDLLDRGVPLETVIVDVLAAAQTIVGDRWLTNVYSVADEHRATGAAQSALDALSRTVAAPPATSGFVIMVCAEEDWHALPAQMLAELLRERGIRVTFLGPSTPVEHVARLLIRSKPDAVAVSCTMPLHFPGVTRLAHCAHQHGIPLLAGGRGLGANAARALMLGADAWAAGVEDSVTILNGWRERAPELCPAPEPREQAVKLDARAPQIASEALAVLMIDQPSMSRYSQAQLDRIKEDLALMTRSVAAAGLVDDPTVLDDFLAWLSTMLTFREVPATALSAALTALAPVINRCHRGSGQLVRDALTLISA